MAKDLFSSHPPITPPTTEEDRLSWLRLIRSPRVGPTTFHRLLHEHGSAQAALDALPEVARLAGVRDYTPFDRTLAEAEFDAARACGARALLHGTPDYPAALAAITDPPPLLWAIGRPALLHQPGVALVGARNASSLGTRMARRLAEGLGHAGLAVVSGIARGIDASAHRAALKTGTIAVMAGGVDMIYPSENTQLYWDIAEHGLLLSEQPMGMAPQARHFPRRNRIVSGLAHAVIVVEAAEKSGSLITARDALDQGREVMAVPGHPVDGRAGGCNLLIREGATLVRGAEDVLKSLGQGAALNAAPQPHAGAAQTGQGHMNPPPAPSQSILPPIAPRQHIPPAMASVATRRPQPAAAESRVEARPPPDTAPLRDRLLSALGPSPMAEDQLIRDIGQPTATILAELVALELDGAIQRHPGGLVSLG